MPAPVAAPAPADALLAELPPERRAVVAAVRDLVRAALPAGYEEQVSGRMLTYVVPLARYPATYNKQPLMYAALAAQKHHYALYLTCAYADPAQAEALRAGFARAGKRLDMGKSCVRFKKLEDVALDVLGEAILRAPAKAYIAHYESVIRPPDKKKAPAAKKAPTAKKAPAKKAAVAKKKPAAKKRA